MEKKQYIQKPVFSKKGLVLFFGAVLLLIAALCCVLNQISLFFCIFLLGIGIALEILWLKSLTSGIKGVLRFVEEKSVSTHKCHVPITQANIVRILKQEGFSIKEYPYQNYECFLVLHKKYSYHFFIVNQDTLDNKSTTEFSKLFFQKMREAACAGGIRYFVDFQYGFDLEKKAPVFLAATKKGFITTKNGLPFGFRIAYDTKTNILYYAEAIVNVLWQKNEQVANYTSALFYKLFENLDKEPPK